MAMDQRSRWLLVLRFVLKYCGLRADEIAKLFPNLFGQPSALLVPSDSETSQAQQKLKIGVVLSGGQAPGGHNVICGIYGEDQSCGQFDFVIVCGGSCGWVHSLLGVADYLQDLAKGSTLYGFRGGPAGIMKCKYVELTSEYIYPYRNQVRVLDMIFFFFLTSYKPFQCEAFYCNSVWSYLNSSWGKCVIHHLSCIEFSVRSAQWVCVCGDVEGWSIVL